VRLVPRDSDRQSAYSGFMNESPDSRPAAPGGAKIGRTAPQLGEPASRRSDALDSLAREAEKDGLYERLDEPPPPMR